MSHPSVATREAVLDAPATPEAAWSACGSLHRVPLLPLDEWLAADARLVVVAPHPDDEVLACGGLVASHAARNGRVVILAVTNGGASHPGCAEWTPASLAVARRNESLAGLACLTGGDGPLRIELNLADGAVADDIVHLTQSLQQHLRHDDVVVTTWQADGHPDHDATSAATATACSAVGCRLLQAPVWLWHWAECEDTRVPWQRLRGLVLRDDAWQRKQQALDAHVSQLQPRSSGEGPVLDRHIVQRARRRCEYFFV